jgi:hypothetical protein
MGVTNPATVRVSGYLVGAALLLIAALTFLAQVQVSDDVGASRSCGSALDVAVGRIGWPDWWSQDLSDPDLGGGDELVRTEDCPDAVNRQQVVAGVFAFGAGLAVTATELLRARFGGSPRQAGDGPTLAWLGTAVALLGTVLLLAGLAGVVLLVADPDDTLFLFVSRPTVALIGLVLLLPAVVLVIAGQVLRLTGKRLEGDDPAGS